jgi:sugar fermentation stimulation protein A
VQLPPLIEARLIRRYKRFLVDVRLANGSVETVFVPNTGSMLGCIEPDSLAYLKELPATAKYRYSLVLVKPGKCLVGVDTSIPNRVVLEAARAQQIEALAGYSEYVWEMPLGKSSRADLCCRIRRDNMLARCWVEVKNTTLARDGCAEFPDTVTARGLKHLAELSRCVRQGDRAVQVFFVQRADCERFTPAGDIDPAYAAGLRAAAAAGVEVVALQAAVTKRSITIKRHIPVEL